MCGVDFLPGCDPEKLSCLGEGSSTRAVGAEPEHDAIRLIIAGGRKFNQGALFNHAILLFLEKHGQPDQVICGMAPGADTMAWLWAKGIGVPVEECPADWDRYGLGAGPHRNRQMARLGTHLLAFWDGRSSGTWSMINLARDKGLEVKVVGY